MASENIDRKIAVIFATDVVGYSTSMEVNEVQTLKNLKACKNILQDFIYFVIWSNYFLHSKKVNLLLFLMVKREIKRYTNYTIITIQFESFLSQISIKYHLQE